MAMLELNERGLLLNEGGYQLLQLARGGWSPVDTRGNDLPEGLRLELRVDDLPATLKKRLESEKAAAGPDGETEEPQEQEQKQELPQVWIFSTGEFLPFELSVVDAAEEHRYTIAGTAGGRIEIIFESNVR